tara:strand:- start:746 stop:982 length:237 start_codon:yes stop_codon:yes gene_type:complete
MSECPQVKIMRLEEEIEEQAAEIIIGALEFIAELEEENARLRDALDNLLDECTNQGGRAEDYINALKKAEAALEVDDE